MIRLRRGPRRVRIERQEIDHAAMLAEDAMRLDATRDQAVLNMADTPEEWLTLRYAHLAATNGRPVRPVERFYWITLWAAWRVTQGRRASETFPLADRLFWASDADGWVSLRQITSLAGPNRRFDADLADLAEMDFLIWKVGEGVTLLFLKRPPLGIKYAARERGA